MATLRSVMTARAYSARTPNKTGFEEPNTPAVLGAFRRQPIIMGLRARPGWKAWLNYPVIRKPDITTVPQVHSTAFQPITRYRQQWIIPGAEPWWSWAGNTGQWFKAWLPNIALPGGAQQQVAPRFPYVWSWPRPNNAPKSQNVKQGPN